ncbi:MAG: sulfatase, partial [Haloarculaceae archaeon]
ADHGENQGELNVYGDHQTADRATCRVPLVVHGPGVEPGRDDDLHYHVDFAPTLLDLLDVDVPDGWDGRSFADSVTDGEGVGRDYLVLSQGAWACQRGVRWDDYLLVRTHHDGLKDFAPVELYDVERDPHETENLARDRPDAVREGLALLSDWTSARLRESATGEAGGWAEGDDAVEDPLWRVMREGGPYHTRGHLEEYVDRLRETGRADHAARLESTRGVVETTVRDYLTDE